MNKKRIITIIFIFVIVIIAILIFNKNKSSNKVITNTNTENSLVKDPNIANFVDEDTGYYVIYNEKTGEEIARVKTKDEIYYYETHQNDVEENIENEIKEEPEI